MGLVVRAKTEIDRKGAGRRGQRRRFSDFEQTCSQVLRQSFWSHIKRVELLLKIARSVISGDALIPLIAEAYDLSGPISCHLHATGDNDNYIVDAGSEKYFLRVYYPHRFWISGPDYYRFELDLLEFLRGQSLRVSHSLVRKDGERLGHLDAPEGIRHWALFTFAQGREIFPMSLDQYHEYGEWVARFHITCHNFKSKYHRFHFDHATLLDTPLRILTERFGSTDESITFLRDLVPRVKDRLDALIFPDDGYGVIGGDFHGGNNHIDEQGKMTFIDFDVCGYGH
jgi:Ser/Thr protein kinase RdoA (MazF antagonist)